MPQPVLGPVTSSRRHHRGSLDGVLARARLVGQTRRAMSGGARAALVFGVVPVSVVFLLWFAFGWFRVKTKRDRRCARASPVCPRACAHLASRPQHARVDPATARPSLALAFPVNTGDASRVCWRERPRTAPSPAAAAAPPRRRVFYATRRPPLRRGASHRPRGSGRGDRRRRGRRHRRRRRERGGRARRGRSSIR